MTNDGFHSPRPPTPYFTPYAWSAYDAEAQAALYRAKDETGGMGETHLTPLHLVLALLADEDSGAVRALRATGVEPARLRAEIGCHRTWAEGTPADLQLSRNGRKTMDAATLEAQDLGSERLGSEHILLGLARGNPDGVGRILGDLGTALPALIRETDNASTRVLEKLGVSNNRIRVEVEKQLPRGVARPSQDMTLTPRAKRVIDLAYDEARNLNNDYIGAEHLLLGLVREGDGLAGRVLAKLGVEIERARREVMALHDGGASETRAAPSPPDEEAPTTPFDWAGFDDGAQTLMLRADDERTAVADAQVSPLHLLLALLEDEGSPAVAALTRLGVGTDALRVEIDKYRVWAAGSPYIPLSPNARRVVDAAYAEARLLGSPTLGAEHLLLGLVRGNPQGAGRILENLGVSFLALRGAVTDGETPPEDDAPPDEGTQSA